MVWQVPLPHRMIGNTAALVAARLRVFMTRRSSGSKRLVALLAALAPAAAFAVYPNTGPDAIFNMVGQFGGASAVAIDPFWVLTAAHVDGGQFVLPGIGTYNVVQDVTHPFADLRLLRVDQAMPVYSRIDMSDEV